MYPSTDPVELTPIPLKKSAGNFLRGELNIPPKTILGRARS
jgi:hypothetical protein